MVGALVAIVGLVLIGIGYGLGTFAPLSGFESPIPPWLAWASAGAGLPIAIVGVAKLFREIREQVDVWIRERDELDARKRALGIR